MTCGIEVAKLSGAGNDFVLIAEETAHRLGADLAAWVRRICRRGVSVGADGVLVLERVDARCVRVTFFNPDGKEAFCGNGSRCAARFAWLERWVETPEMTLETRIGRLPAVVKGDRVRLTLPAPEDRGVFALGAGGHEWQGRWIVAGVPHFVIEVDDVARVPLAEWGPLLRRHERFGPEGTNVDVASRLASGDVALRTWERGVEGETLSCGSAAVAVAAVMRLGRAPDPVRLIPAGGIPLEVSIPDTAPRRAVLTGDARLIFKGQLAPDATRGF